MTRYRPLPRNVTTTRRLNEREERFAREYLVDFNGQNAALRAGVPPKAAAQQAYDMLSRPQVIAAINELRDKQAQRMLVSAENVLDELAIVGFSDIRAYWPAPGERLDISRLDRRLTAAIAQIDIDETPIPGEDGCATLALQGTGIW